MKERLPTLRLQSFDVGFRFEDHLGQHRDHLGIVGEFDDPADVLDALLHVRNHLIGHEGHVCSGRRYYKRSANELKRERWKMVAGKRIMRKIASIARTGRT